MPKLFVENYRRFFKGKIICIACREGILRDHYGHIVSDIKFLNRQGIQTRLVHNLSNRFANQQHFEDLERRLPDTRIDRVPPEQDFYSAVLAAYAKVSKIIFLERKYLIDEEGNRINAISTTLAHKTFDSYGGMIANQNFKGVIDKICEKIEQGALERVHILPAAKNTIRNELFSVEGSGTLIANNFEETFCTLEDPSEILILFDILKKEQRKAFLKYRSKEYLRDHIGQLYVTKIDGIMVGCCEKKWLLTDVVELGSLVTSTKFRNQRVGVFMIKAFIEKMREEGAARIVSLTRNQRLGNLYLSLGFQQFIPPGLEERQARSPKTTMYTFEL